MLHVLGLLGSTHAATNFSLTPIADSWIPIQNGHFFPPDQMSLFGGWFGSVDLTAITLVSPRSRMVVPPRLYPIQAALLPPDRPHIWDRRTNPFTLNRVEEVDFQVNVGGAADENIHAILFVGDQLDPVPPGDIYSLHGTSTTTATANAWTQLTITWDQTIPSGTYMVIGTQHQSTNAVAHRLYFRYKPNKPGFLSVTSLGNITDPSYYFGGWGALGRFDTTAYPFVEALCNAADASHDVVLNLIKI